MVKKIYIHCEITKREFEAKLLLSTIAANNNFEVYMGNIEGLEKNIHLPSGLLHFTSCTPAKRILDLFKRLKRKKFIITAQDEEGGVEEIKNFFSKPPVGIFYYRFSNKSLKYVDAIFSWSNFDYDNLIKRFSKYKKKIFNTGNPRADMWSKILKKSYFNKNEKNQKYILINSHTDGPASNKRLIENLKIIKDAYYFNDDKEFENTKINYFNSLSKRTDFMYIYTEAIIELSRKFKNEKFIFRPHPIENLETWKFLFRNCTNIRVTKEKSSTYWMHRSKLLIQNGCYTAIEAANLELDIISFIPDILKDLAKPFTANLGFKCKNKKDLIKLVIFLNNNRNKNKILKKKIENKKKVNSRIHFPTKILNADKIVHIWKLLYKNENSILFENIIFEIQIFFKNLKYRFFNLKSNGKIYDRKFEDINFEETNLMMINFIKILGLSEKIRLKMITKHICRIVKK